MTNHKKQIIFGVVIILLLVSVPVSSLSQPTFIKQKMKINPSAISFSDATQTASLTIKQYGKTATHTIQDHTLIYDENHQNILAFLFSLSPHGYIIIPNSYDLHPVLAYSFTNNATFLNHQHNPFIPLIQYDIQSRIDNNHLSTEETKQHINSLWNQKTKEKTTIEPQYLIEHWPPEGTTETEGWIETTWHQNAPFKNFCPMDLTTGKRSIAGCPSIAMGQILHYHQTINNVIFNDTDDYQHVYLERYVIDDDYETYDFASFPMLNQYLQNLKDHYDNQEVITDDDKAALIFSCGVAAKQVYSSQVSGTYGVNQAYQAYMKFNCTTARLLQDDIEYTYDQIIEDIKQARPVHLAVVNDAWTTGHNLVIDGYNTAGYFHLNFGFGGRYDGWYYIPNEIPFELTVLEGVIVDIMENATESDLSTKGHIEYSKVKPGSTLNDTFQVINVGQPGSELHWSIEKTPDWGEWMIHPDTFENLTPEDGPLTVSVSVVVPDQKKQTLTGGITLVNKECPGDRSIVPITISIKTIKDHNKTLDKPFIFFTNHIKRCFSDEGLKPYSNSALITSFIQRKTTTISRSKI